MKHIYSLYSDNDEINCIKNLEDYASKLDALKILIKGAGHFNPKSNIKSIKELNNILIKSLNLR